jgi:hypothetical protein
LTPDCFFSSQVTVSDSEDPFQRLTSTCVVQITIDDVNDERPRFEPVPQLSIAENSAANSPIATIRAVDRDVGKNAEVEYILEDSQMGKFRFKKLFSSVNIDKWSML